MLSSLEKHESIPGCSATSHAPRCVCCLRQTHTYIRCESLTFFLSFKGLLSRVGFADRPPDVDKTTSVFCPAEQFGGEDFLQFGSCCTDLEEGVVEAKFLEAGALTTACADLYKQVCEFFWGGYDT